MAAGPVTAQGGGGNRVLLIVVGILVAVCIVLPVVIICILALLGPAIGNIFSSINESLFINLLNTPF
jgi:hypothetical protein